MLCLREVGTFISRIKAGNVTHYILTIFCFPSVHHPSENFLPDPYLSFLFIPYTLVETLNVHSTGLAVGGSKAIENNLSPSVAIKEKRYSIEYIK